MLGLGVPVCLQNNCGQATYFFAARGAMTALKRRGQDDYEETASSEIQKFAHETPDRSGREHSLAWVKAHGLHEK
jgi:hypothetical protein